MMEHAVTTFNQLPIATIYLLLFIVVILEYIFPPIPGDTIIMFGAYLVGTGKLDLITLYLLTTLGSVGGFLILFGLGKYYGRGFFLKKNYRFFSKEMIIKTEAWFQRYGTGLIVANRFLAGARSAISLIAGISNMKLFTATLAALLSSMVWNSVLIAGGYYLGKNWHLVLTIIRRYNQSVTVILILSFLFYLWKRRKRKTPCERTHVGQETTHNRKAG